MPHAKRSIMRRWSSRIRTENREAYVAYIAGTGIPDYAATPGNLGCEMLARDLGDGTTEVTTLSWWPSMDTIRAFAGEDADRARYYPEDDRFLLAKPPGVEHHDVVAVGARGIAFEKMHANGDDFALIDLRGDERTIAPALVRRLADRERGIGFHQLAALSDGDDSIPRLSFWNPDGSVLDACGSATRGAALKLMEEKAATKVMVRTARGLLACSRPSDGHISVDMGAPLLSWSDIPLAEAMDTLTLPLFGAPAACSMGNPHCTYFVEDAEAIAIEELGPAIERNPLFPQGANVHFVEIIDPARIRLRIWERGGGVSPGSGSCACAAVVNGIRRGLLDRSVEVQCDGGILHVAWDGAGVTLTGPVERSFSGIWAGTPVEEG
ncbi:diaminopimelate epimerase [Sphingomonas sp. QA11]|uniref:diaminopimelate epimerase n=1 Tax=Sphingomonas sp. QA11 TaxID=2950605 RepID=UPI0023495836|nr:diaminopimelate epimerase [Sphingomonas sp. QA11]WCM25986.1 diaminopimelate epimerase [Sphingomonas sp. QA11]